MRVIALWMDLTQPWVVMLLDNVTVTVWYKDRNVMNVWTFTLDFLTVKTIVSIDFEQHQSY